MQILETKVYPLDGLKIELYDLKPTPKLGVRMYDTDADKTIWVRLFPVELPDARQRAYKYFDELVRKCNLAGDM